MSDNVSLAEQTTCIDSGSEDDWYNIDIFSHVQSELDENNVSHKQIIRNESWCGQKNLSAGT